MVCKMCCIDYLNIAALALQAPWLGFHGRHKQALHIMQDLTGGNHLFQYWILLIKPISGHNDPSARSIISN